MPAGVPHVLARVALQTNMTAPGLPGSSAIVGTSTKSEVGLTQYADRLRYDRWQVVLLSDHQKLGLKKMMGAVSGRSATGFDARDRLLSHRSRAE